MGRRAFPGQGNPMENISEPTPISVESEGSSSGLMKSLRFPLTFGLVSCSGVEALLFTATFLLEGITRPGYDASQQPISALSLGTGGWVQQVNFVVFGILTLLSAFGWHGLLRPGGASIVFPLFQSLAGLGLIGIGFFLSIHFLATPRRCRDSIDRAWDDPHGLCVGDHSFLCNWLLCLSCTPWY
jgi:Protein of unknown function (DUF998)